MGRKPWYATRESVKTTLDVMETAQANAQVDRAIDAASRSAEGLLRRTFYPRTETKFFAWPNAQYARSWRLWLGMNELISVSSLTAGGAQIPEEDFFLEPHEFGPPYDRIEIDLDSSSAFQTAGTHQRSIAITGLWGYSDDSTAVGSLAEALDASEADVDVDAATAAQVGVGSVLKAGSERFTVVGRSTLPTGQTLLSGLEHLDNDVRITVADGAAFAVDEVITVDSEKLRITDITGNTLTVTRAWDGSVLAAHTSGADIYAYRTLTVTRGDLGTTATPHDSGTVLYRWDPPALLNALVIAEAVVMLQQGAGGYARTTTAGESQVPAAGRGITDLREAAKHELGRQARLGAA